MTDDAGRAIAVVGVGAILPDAPDAATFWAEPRSRPLQITDVCPTAGIPTLYYDPDPQGARQDLLEDRRLGARWNWDPLDWQPPDPAAGRRRHGRRPEVGRRLQPRRR